MNPELAWLKDYVAELQVSYHQGDERLIESDVDSLDVNDHVAQVAELFAKLPEARKQGGALETYYRGKRMFIGDGPRYSAASIRLIADMGAGLSQDIYCTCIEDAKQGQKDA